MAQPASAAGSNDLQALPDLSTYGSVLFDLDGVLTPTAEVHMRAWAVLFEGYLTEQGVVPPYSEQDYFDHIDGKQRYQGADALLRSRGIELPWGDPDDPPGAETVCGLGNRKDVVFKQVLQDEGVKPYPGSVALLDRLEAHGARVAVVSSSRNARTVLAAAGLAERFSVVVDGLTAAEEGLSSKPDPATYLRAAGLLGVAAQNCVVVEDALSGVAAGRAGEFGLVVGVDRGAGREELIAAGADLVVTDLAELVGVLAAPLLDRARFPVEEWRFVERVRPTAAQRGHTETLFALGNGYLGLRGNSDEDGPAYEHGTFINGFHETWPLSYPEAAYGFAEVGQAILNLPDAKSFELWVDGERFDPETADVDDYERVLDMAAGVLERRLVWRTAAGNRVKITTQRLVSFEFKHLALLGYTVTPLDAAADVVIHSRLVDRQSREAEANGGSEAADSAAEAPFDPRKSDDVSGALQPTLGGLAGPAGDWPYLAQKTRNSGLGLAVMAAHDVTRGGASGDHGGGPGSGAGGGGGGEVHTANEATAYETRSTFETTVAPGEALSLTKLVAYHDGSADGLQELVAACQETLTLATGALETAGRGALQASQRRWLDDFWADADVQVPGQPAVQQALRWNLFQLVQAAARADGRGVPAKGVSGSGYSGHYFWDTEIYVLPYFIHTRPEIARAALEFRHAMLPAARRRAAVMAESGALFPWRTINGEEASAYYPAGTAQYHINADITYAVAKYTSATDDGVFMRELGAEIAIETARMWATLGFYEAPEVGGATSAGRSGPGELPVSFHLNGVTGPDEYSAVVDDNFYTNVMAAFNLRFAADVVEGLTSSAPAAFARLSESLSLRPDEPASWRRAADAMALPYDGERGVNVQDAGFLRREPWDLAATPPDKRPLLLHFHPLVIYRHQVLKQADLVLALYLHARLFSLEQKRADFDFYDPLTSGDSTLSAAVQSIVAAEVGHQQLAMAYFERMLYVDLGDLHANTADGAHIASTGGTWQALVGGFAGMRDDAGALRFDPRLPEAWSELAFVVRTRGSKLRVRLEPHRMSFTLEDGPEAKFQVRGRDYLLVGAEPLEVEL